MRLLTEIHESVNFLTEGEGPKAKHYIEGLFLEFDNFNRNGRIYRSEWCDPAVLSYIKEKVDDGRGWGELDHPEGATINLKNTSHRITEMHKDGSNWHGKAIITNTPTGHVVLGLQESGGRLGVSSRAMGAVKHLDEGKLEVQQDLRFLTAADVVSDPSAHGALVRGIMENVEWFYNEENGEWLPERSTAMKKAISKMSLKEIEEKKIAIFESFINSLKQA